MFKFIVLAFVVGVVYADHINKDAETKSYHNDINVDGSYKYSYETSNGISAQESGTGGEHARITGTHHWVSPEGTPVDITYVADENGYQPTGNVIPVAPPVPELILRALEYIRAHPAKDEPHHRKF